MINVGHRAPAFRLKNALGEPVALKDYDGKYLVLYFYPRDMTPGCTVEAKNFQTHLRELTELGAEVVGVSKDTPDRHKKFATKYDLTFTLLSDPDGKTIEKYGAWKEKSLYGRSFMGVARMTYLIGPDGKVLKVYPKVSPKTHAPEILTDLKEYV
jgi:thioredoxin-dependent peroxiredoxin